MISPRYQDHLPDLSKHKENKAFARFVGSLLSCLDGNYPCECCHVRRINQGAGIGRKPPFYAVPMTHEQHVFQHQHGELACLQKYVPAVNWTLDSAKWFFENEAMKVRVNWMEKLAATA